MCQNTENIDYICKKINLSVDGTGIYHFVPNFTIDGGCGNRYPAR